MLQIYNTFTQQKEVFKPLKPGKVGIYTCGMTVYDDCHIGHARATMVVFDVVVRYLRSRGYDVTYVRNITDVDDKIIKRANENKESYFDLTERVIKSVREDAAALGVLPPTHEPRATEYIPKIIELIQILVNKGHAYTTENGDVCFDVSSFEHYGELAHQDMTKLRAGARVNIVDTKTDPLDFVLWKLAKPGEPYWPSPWGEGRPGWHIECSAMSMDCLGTPFDIHGGGSDLVFPHHQNELAQSEAACGHQFVKTWMHVGFVQINKEKMSKSLGNFFTIKEVLKQYPAEVVRYFLLASHYRSPVNYSAENLQSAQNALERFYIALRDLPAVSELELQNNEFEARFNTAMDDDFNTPEALAVLFDLAREINRVREHDLAQAAQLGCLLRRLGSVLGILQQDAEKFLRAGTDVNEVKQIELLIAARNMARNNKDWAEADRVRQELTELGISLEDTPTGTIWRKI